MQFNAWCEDWSADSSLQLIDFLAARHAALGGAVGEELLRLITEKNYYALVHKTLELSKVGWNVDELYHCRQVLGFYQKSEWLDIGIDKEAVARNAYFEREVMNKTINNRFRSIRLGGHVSSADGALILAVRRIVGEILGDCPQIGDLACYFGPGATVGTKKADACPLNKMRGPLTCSTDLYHSWCLPELIRSFPQWFDHRAEEWTLDAEGFIVMKIPLELEASRLGFVNKNSKTKRSIDVQPVVNAFFQSGIGSYIADRLGDEGVDISDQTANQAAAQSGSVSDDLVTLDLKDASNSKVYEVIKILMSDRWFELLSASRCGLTTFHNGVRRETHRLEMFSAMGNGFTFPLETLIFYSICKATCSRPEEIRVFGDDIVVAKADADVVVAALSFFGFSVNMDKSFFEGPFRESCGADFYVGTNVRPYFQKRLISAESLFTLHNYYRRRGLDDFACIVKGLIPKWLRLYGPDGMGDGHLISETWQHQTPPNMVSVTYTKFPVVVRNVDNIRPQGWDGSWFLTYTKEPRALENPCHGDLAAPLYALERRKPVDALKPALCETPTPTRFTPSGRPIWSLPGYNGVRRTKVYTFERSADKAL